MKKSESERKRVRSYFDRERVPTVIEGKSATKQSEKDECDIRMIMKKHSITGFVSHLSKRTPMYGDFGNGGDYHEAALRVRKAEVEFMELPADVRQHCDNDVGTFLEWISDPELGEEHQEFGMEDLHEALKPSPMPGEWRSPPSEPEAPPASENESVQRPAPSAPAPSDEGTGPANP